MHFTETIANLRTELKSANEKLTSITAEHASQATQITQLTEQNTTNASKIANLEGQVTTLTSENADLKGKLDLAQKNVAGQVIDTIASAGVPAIARVDNGSANTPAGNQGESGKTGLERAAAAFSAQLTK